MEQSQLLRSNSKYPSKYRAVMPLYRAVTPLYRAGRGQHRVCAEHQLFRPVSGAASGGPRRLGADVSGEGNYSRGRPITHTHTHMCLTAIKDIWTTIFTLLFLPSSSANMSCVILSVPMRKWSGKHSSRVHEVYICNNHTEWYLL